MVSLLEPKPKLDRREIYIPELPSGGSLHKEVALCRFDLKGVKPDIYGRLVSKRTDMQVSRKTLPRVLALLIQIVRTALKLDCYVDTPKDCIVLCRGDVSVHPNMYEGSTRSSGKVRNGNYEKVQQIFTPFGQLKFRLRGVYGLPGVQREWNDRVGCHLELQIVSILRNNLRAIDGMVVQQIEETRRQHQCLVVQS